MSLSNSALTVCSAALLSPCAVRCRAASRTSPAHRVHLLCRRRAGRLQHHRHPHPEIVSLSRRKPCGILRRHRWCRPSAYFSSFPHKMLSFTTVLPPLPSCSRFFYNPSSARLSSPQEVIALGDEAASVGCAASPTPVFFFPLSFVLSLFNSDSQRLLNSSHTHSSLGLFTPAGFR